MDPKGNIYEGTDENPVKPEDAARLDGYLRARAELDALTKEKMDALDAKLTAAEEKAEERGEG